MNTAIRIQKLSVQKAGRALLNKVSAELPTGKITGVIGPSGAGKTTLMRTIVGLQQPSSGSVEVLDLPAGSTELRAKTGYMTQAVSLYPDLTLIDNLRFFAAMTSTPAERIARVLRDVDLRRQAKQMVGTLSGGQQSRASLAVALLSRPDLLILDEPTVGLDPVLRNKLWELFNELKNEGATILLTSHAMDEAEHCDELLLLRDGKVLAAGSPKGLIRKTRSRSVEESFIQLVGKKK